MAATIEDALALARARKYDDALEAALVAWRAAASEALARAISLLSEKLTREPFTGRTRAIRHKEWIDTAEHRDPADVPRLLAELPRFLRATSTRLLDDVLTWDADPRVVDAMFALVRDPPDGFRGLRAQPFWNRVCQIIGKNVQPYQRGALAALADHVENHGDRSTALPEYLVPRLRQVLEAAPREDTAMVDDAATTALLAALAPRGAERRRVLHVDDLYAAVYENPDDDDVRMVLADALNERGDPHGELIAIQMKRKGGHRLTKELRTRERQLLTAYGRKWLGRIEPAVAKTGLKYERGFPSAVVLTWPGESDPGSSLPEWSTLRSIDASRWRGAATPILVRHAKQLHRILGASDRIFDAHAEFTVEHLTLSEHGIEPGKPVTPVATFPNLRTLGLASMLPGLVRRLWRPDGIGEQLDLVSASSIFACGWKRLGASRLPRARCC